MKRSPLKRGNSQLTRTTPIKPVNAKRRKKESQRTYGPKERREWMRAGVCEVCARQPIHQAHVPSGSGAGRKGDARWTIRLCPEHHRELDEGIGPKGFREVYGIDVWEVARRTEAAWQEYQRQEDA